MIDEGGNTVFRKLSTINRRMELFEQCVNKNIHVLFCDENFLLDSVEGLDYIKKCLEF